MENVPMMQSVHMPAPSVQETRLQVLKPIINIPREIDKLHSMGLLDKLLFDRTTRRNITWATDDYAGHGEAHQANREITSNLIVGANSGLIKARAAKSKEEQTERTRKKGEVFTPTWVCKKMNDHCEAMLREETDDWRKFVDAREMEITCGEAPFLVSRYDMQSGEMIPIHDRVGLLDRKLREVSSHVQTEEEWRTWARRAYEATYGYEFQGDNLLIARINLMMTLYEYYEDRFGYSPDHGYAKKLATVISWNIWQMNGLTGHTPVGVIRSESRQMSLFESPEDTGQTESNAPECVVFDWRAKHSLKWSEVGQ